VRDESTSAQPTEAARLAVALLLPRPPAMRGDMRLRDADAPPHAAAGVHSDMLVYVAEVRTLTAEEVSAMRHPLVVFWCVNERLFTTTLAQLARQVPSICATETQSEWAASLAGLIDAVRSARLSDRAPPRRDDGQVMDRTAIRGRASTCAACKQDAALRCRRCGGSAGRHGRRRRSACSRWTERRVDESGIRLAVIDVNPAVINDYGEVDVAEAAQGDGR
jgi:hypothetical protein